MSTRFRDTRSEYQRIHDRSISEAALQKSLIDVAEMHGWKRNYDILDRTKYANGPAMLATSEAVTTRIEVVMCPKSTPKRDKFTRTSPTQIKVHCSHCNRPHFVVPSKAKRQDRFYCDLVCRDSDKRPLKQRFLEKVVYLPGGCWQWMGFVGKRGYGMIAGVEKYSQPITAHSASYRIFIGDIPEGMVLDHKCRNRWCVNPDHLRTCTPSENPMNQSISSRNKSGFLGVHFDISRHSWVAMVSTNGKSTYVGRFDTARDAAIARDRAAKEVYGEFANLNFPEGDAS